MGPVSFVFGTPPHAHETYRRSRVSQVKSHNTRRGCLFRISLCLSSEKPNDVPCNPSLVCHFTKRATKTSSTKGKPKRHCARAKRRCPSPPDLHCILVSKPVWAVLAGPLQLLPEPFASSWPSHAEFHDAFLGQTGFEPCSPVRWRWRG